MYFILTDGSTVEVPGTDGQIHIRDGVIFFADVMFRYDQFVALIDGDGDCCLTPESLAAMVDQA